MFVCLRTHSWKMLHHCSLSIFNQSLNSSREVWNNIDKSSIVVSTHYFLEPSSYSLHLYWTFLQETHYCFLPLLLHVQPTKVLAFNAALHIFLLYRCISLHIHFEKGRLRLFFQEFFWSENRWVWAWKSLFNKWDSLDTHFNLLEPSRVNTDILL